MMNKILELVVFSQDLLVTHESIWKATINRYYFNNFLISYFLVIMTEIISIEVDD